MTAKTSSEFTKGRPSRNTRRVLGWINLPNRNDPAEFEFVTDDGKRRTFWASKNKRRILEALMLDPMYCASPCRLSHYVQLMRDELGKDFIETKWYDNDPATGRERFGVYTLGYKVCRVNRQGVRS